MKEDFVSYELAIKLKEKGFREKCQKHCYPNSQDWFISSTPECDNFSNYLDIPTIYQVLKWLREEKNLSVEPYSCACGWRVTICKTGNVLEGYVSGGTCVKDEVKGHNDGGAFDWYEQAALAGIEYVIDNLI